jgi:hypothetical protein
MNTTSSLIPVDFQLLGMSIALQFFEREAR